MSRACANVQKGNGDRVGGGWVPAFIRARHVPQKYFDILPIEVLRQAAVAKVIQMSAAGWTGVGGSSSQDCLAAARAVKQGQFTNRWAPKSEAAVRRLDYAATSFSPNLCPM
jgi:hypothetical protein